MKPALAFATAALAIGLVGSAAAYPHGGQQPIARTYDLVCFMAHDAGNRFVPMAQIRNTTQLHLAAGTRIDVIYLVRVGPYRWTKMTRAAYVGHTGLAPGATMSLHGETPRVAISSCAASVRFPNAKQTPPRLTH